MIDEIRERVNEAGRLFAFRKEQLAARNFHTLHRVVQCSAIAYFVFLVLHFISHLYRIPWTDAVLAPVFIIFLKGIPSIVKDNEVMSFNKVRILSLMYYFSFLTGVSVIEIFPLNSSARIILFPLFLIVFSVYYMDYIQVIMLSEAVFVLVYELIAYSVGQMSSARLYTGLFALFLSVFVYWSVLGTFTDERRDNRALEEKSSKDGLTGLLNKVSCEEEIRHYLDHRKEGAACALIMLDFDNFKHVNDAYGHQVGDDALKKFGEIMRRNFRNTDILGRMGGDEFMALVREPVSEEILIKICNSVEYELATSRFGEAKGFTCSIGVARDPEGYSFEGLYHVADDALYEAKARGKAQYVLWSTKKIVPMNKRIIYIASGDRKKREAIKRICGSDYLYYEADTATEAFNDISLYGDHLESIYFDYSYEDITKDQIREYMDSRPLYSVLPVHDVELELKKSKIEL